MKTEVPTNYHVRFFRTEVQELCTPPEDGMSRRWSESVSTATTALMYMLSVHPASSCIQSLERLESKNAECGAADIEPMEGPC